MFLIAGATGSVGRHVVGQLLAEGHQVRALTRRPDQANLPTAAEVMRCDLADPDQFRAALRGVHAIYLLAMGGAPRRLVELAEQAGVRRLVLLSTGDVVDGVERQPDAVAELHRTYEIAVESSTLEWTFLRPNEFAGNSLLWAPQIKAGNVVRAPYGMACTAAIHERDIAAVAVRALIDDGHHGATYYLTGPEALTHIDQVRHIADALGRELRFEEIPAEAARQQMITYAPPAIVDAVLNQLAAHVAHPAKTTSAVQEVTGRPARTFAEWAAEHVEDFQ